MIEFESDIPSLTDEGIQIDHDSFKRVRVISSSSMGDWLIMTKILILLIDSFVKEANNWIKWIL